MGRQRVVFVSGAIANKHLNGGEAWVRLNWLLGLRKAGCRVFFAEQIQSKVCVDDTGAPTTFQESANRRFFEDVMSAFGLDENACLICDEGCHVQGIPMAETLDAAGEADVLINISGHMKHAEILKRIRRKAYIDLDPGFTQFWHEQGYSGMGLAGHDFYFTVGENIGRSACLIPDCGLDWMPKRRFAVLNEWPVCQAREMSRFTTVAAWRGSFGPVHHNGRRFGLKVHEFRKIIPLPARTSQSFEIALRIDPADRADLERLLHAGWQITDPRLAAGDPFKFRRYLQRSGAEFSAAQGIYVETNSGWLSDRTIRYLASGRPALVQDTGFSRNYPVGEGLVGFRNLDEAVAGAESIARDYPRHARAARALAEAYFDSDIVLPEMFDRMGIAL